MVVSTFGRDKPVAPSSGSIMQPFVANSDANDATLPRTQVTIPAPPPPYTAFPYGGAGTGGACRGKKCASTRLNVRGVALTVIFLLFAAVLRESAT